MPRNARALTLILSAMPSEIRLIQGRMDPGAKAGTLAVFPYRRGILKGRPVVTAVTGVGVTNAAMVTALFVHEFGPSEVIVSGTGSRFNPRIRTGDTVISTRTIHHAAGSLTSAGMVYRKVRGPLEGQMTHYQYAPEPRLLRLAKASIRGYEAEPVTANGETYRPTVLTGVVTASDLFGVSDEKIADLRAKLDPDIMEMESAAIAQVCTQLGTPHIVFRAGSNRTQPNPGSDYRKLGQTAAHAAARWTVYFVVCLAAQANGKKRVSEKRLRRPLRPIVTEGRDGSPSQSLDFLEGAACDNIPPENSGDWLGEPSLPLLTTACGGPAAHPLSKKSRIAR